MTMPGSLPGGIRRALRGARGTIRGLVQTISPGVLVLMYHRIADEPCDPDRLCVSPANFAGHLASLRRLGVRLSTAQGLAEQLAAGRAPPRTAVITFDDGYVDNLRAAKPLLDRYEAPATLFVTAGQIGARSEFWWDTLARICLTTAELPDVFDLTPLGDGRRLEVGPATKLAPGDRAAVQDWRLGMPPRHPRHALHGKLYGYLSASDGAARAALCASLLRQAGLPDQARDSHRCMSEAELGEMAADGLVKIGAHTWSHPSLPSLSLAQQSDELVRSKRHLEALLGRPVTGCSHPHGRYTPDTTQLVREAGYAYACTSVSKPARRGADPFEIPRMVVEDSTEARFTQFLEEYLRV